jgi:UPF0755 protein
MKWGAGILILAIGLSAIALGLPLLLFSISPLDRSSSNTIIIEIPKGSGPQKISTLLQEKGAISSASRFQRLGTLTRAWKRVKAGEYEFTPRMTPLEVFQKLSSGQSKTYALTVREGDNLYQIAQKLKDLGLPAAQTFMQTVSRPELVRTLLGPSDPLPPSLEGYLFPETYNIPRSITSEDLARLMFGQFKKAWNPQWESQAKKYGLSRHELVILSSIVEKETGLADDRPLISAVFHNRIQKGMRLQSDPTTIYGIMHRYDGNIRKSDLLERTPYNTYAIPGLPRGPISNPGTLAIEATLNPAPVDYLYFVSRNDGTTVFSRNLQEHNSAVRRFQMDPASRAGKSWRDLKTQSPNADGGVKQ